MEAVATLPLTWDRGGQDEEERVPPKEDEEKRDLDRRLKRFLDKEDGFDHDEAQERLIRRIADEQQRLTKVLTDQLDEHEKKDDRRHEDLVLRVHEVEARVDAIEQPKTPAMVKAAVKGALASKKSENSGVYRFTDQELDEALNQREVKQAAKKWDRLTGGASHMVFKVSVEVLKVATVGALVYLFTRVFHLAP
jgi:hypothetical protein